MSQLQTMSSVNRSTRLVVATLVMLMFQLPCRLDAKSQSVSPSEVGIVNLKGTRATIVDGRSTNSTLLELLPGRHTITFVPIARGAPRGLKTEAMFDAEAGKTYVALWREQTVGEADRTVE